MSIFSDFSIQMSLKLTPLRHIGTILNFVKAYRCFVNPLTISQIFLLHPFLLKVIAKTLGSGGGGG